MNPAIKSALAKVIEEETRLKGELDRLSGEWEKLKAVRRVLEEQAGVTPTKDAHKRTLAPAGALEATIREVLDQKNPKSRSAIIEAIKRKEYRYSLTPLHVTKHLTKLVREKTVKRIGEGVRSGYVILRK